MSERRCGLAAAPAPSDDWTGLRSGVISRMRAEAHESWTARAGRAVRRHAPGLDWPGLHGGDLPLRRHRALHAALRLARAQDSLAAVIAVMAAPSGSDLNPARLDGRIQCAERAGRRHRVGRRWRARRCEGDLVLPLSAMVTREGRVSGLECSATTTTAAKPRSSTSSRAAGSSPPSSADPRSPSTWCGSSPTRRSSLRLRTRAGMRGPGSGTRDPGFGIRDQ